MLPSYRDIFKLYEELSPQEIRVADMVKSGKSTKEISEILKIAPSTVSTYRYNIRVKLGLLNSTMNLQDYLNSYDG